MTNIEPQSKPQKNSQGNPQSNPQSSQESKTILIESTLLRTVMDDLFTRLSVPPNEVAIVADTLMEASLAGYNSHGVMRIPMYAEGLQLGTMIPGAEMVHLRESAASVYLDARCGLGPVAATNATRLATAKASNSGIGCVSVVNCNDLARLGSYVIEPAQEGFITMVMVNDAGSGPAVAPWGGVQPFLSTNPLAVGIPWKRETPVVIDISTSIVAAGQLKTLAAQGETPPEGWLIDQEGQPSQDLAGFLAAAQQSALLPLGGFAGRTQRLRPQSGRGYSGGRPQRGGLQHRRNERTGAQRSLCSGD